MGNMQISKAGCAGIVWGRVNAFKHLTKGVSDRYDFVYAIEWVITTKALEWISAFWREMVSDVESIQARRRRQQPEGGSNETVETH